MPHQFILPNGTGFTPISMCQDIIPRSVRILRQFKKANNANLENPIIVFAIFQLFYPVKDVGGRWVGKLKSATLKNNPVFKF